MTQRRILSLILSSMLFLFLLGCGKEAPVETSQAIVSETTLASEMPAEDTLPQATAVAENPALPEELAAFGRVLQDTQAIYRSTSREAIMISKISLFFTVDELPWDVVQVAVLDMDGDGALEAVLEVENYVGYVILEYQDGTVLGTEVWYRAFQDLKTDGSYRGSGSSFNCYYWQYGADGPVLLAERYETENGEPYYSLSGAETDAETFAAFEEAQNQKEDVCWYPNWDAYLAAK